MQTIFLHINTQSNALLEDEAAEEEEEGAQAGLGDFGFGVTSNIREHDEEQVHLIAPMCLIEVVGLVVFLVDFVEFSRCVAR